MSHMFVTLLYGIGVFSSLAFAGIINNKLSNYFETPGNRLFELDILPEYEVQRYVFPEVIPDSESDVSGDEEIDGTVLYRITNGPNTRFSEGKRPALIQHGILCDASTCFVNRPQIAVAYLLVDQHYDVWLGVSNTDSISNFTFLLSHEEIERAKLEFVAQYILLSTQQPELLVMGNFNGSERFFGITAKTQNEPSRFSRWFEKIPGVKTVKKWYNNIYDKGRSYLTRGYNHIVKNFDNLGKKLDYIMDNQAIRNIKGTVFRAWGMVTSMVGPTMSVEDFSKMINHPDVFLGTPELVTKYGYTVETHEVKTEDGYLLSLHRISGGKKYPPKPGKPTILLQHGLLASSAAWVLAGPSKSLAYILADRGYDVWMGNFRGNTYSRNHQTLLTSDYKYWDFSWHEMGIYDLPAMIDRILAVTKEPKLYYLGHSQGTTSFFVMMSEKPEYNDKVIKFVAYAPMAYGSHVRSPFIKLFAKFSTPIYHAFKYFKIYDFAPNNALLTKIGRYSCEARSFYQIICSNSLFMITGYDSAQLNKTLIPVILGHFPAGSSIKQFFHYGQEVNSHEFRQFDYGDPKINHEKYGQNEPLDYKLNNTKIPTAFFYASNDLLSDIRDVQKAAQKLPRVEMMYNVPMELFNHIDFMFAIDAPALLYEPTIAFLNGTSPS